MSFTITSNSPTTGYIQWAGAHIVYDGVDYAITDGSTNKKYVYWTKAAPGSLQVSDTYPALTIDDCIVFLNKSGVAISVLTATAMEGDLVVPGTVTSSAIATDAIAATHIKSDAVIARHILAGSVTAEKLAVAQLSAISADMGTMTAGNFTLSATGFIRGGATTYASGSGFWMGKDGSYYKFRAGIPGSSRMEWDGTAFNIYDNLGNLTISSGVVDYTRLSNKPTALSDISSAESSKLAGIATGATKNTSRGAWATATLYDQGDITTNAGSTWLARVTHTSASGTNNPPTLPTTSNTWWELLAAKGDQGISGTNGTRTAVLEMYQWAASAPTTFPTGSSTYTWTTGQFTAPATVNGWAITPPAPVVGQTLWVCRTIFADSLTGATSAVTWSASAAMPTGASGTNGSPGANGTRTAILELYQWAASTPTTFPSGSSTYTWATGAFTAPGTPNGWSLTPGAAVAGQTLWGCAVSYADTGTSTTSVVTWGTTTAYAVGAAGANGGAGASAISAVLSNEAHVFPAASDGTVSAYTGSGTEIRVYEGATDLTYDGVGTANGTWKVTTTHTNITPGTLTDSGTYLTVGQHEGVAAGTDTSSITYTITGKTASGIGFTLTKTQTFTKSKQGAGGSTGLTGPAGPSVLVTASRATTFTATDGTLDGSQADITFTAAVSGISSPTYVWSFSGFQTEPTNSGAATQTITAAQFGTSKSATVTCTVSGAYKDGVTVVRLEKSTAAAGATVGAEIGVNLGGKITSGNASTFIDNAAINTAQIGELDAVKLTARSIKTEKIEVGAATANMVSSYTNIVTLNSANTTNTYTVSSTTVQINNLVQGSKLLIAGKALVAVRGFNTAIGALRYSAFVEAKFSSDNGVTWSESWTRFVGGGAMTLYNEGFTNSEGGTRNFYGISPLIDQYVNSIDWLATNIRFRVGREYTFVSSTSSQSPLNPNGNVGNFEYARDFGGTTLTIYEFKV